MLMLAALGTGTGSGALSTAPPPTKDAGTAKELAELPSRDHPIEPRHGILGAPGAAPDTFGPARLGAVPERPRWPSYGETVGTDWRSGDQVRSSTSADVRATRRQSAPDLKWATPRTTASPRE